MNRTNEPLLVSLKLHYGTLILTGHEVLHLETASLLRSLSGGEKSKGGDGGTPTDQWRTPESVTLPSRRQRKVEL